MSNSDLKALREDIKSRLGISDELAERLETPKNLGGHKDVTFNIPIKNGYGCGSDKETTWSVHIHGYGEILAPDDGTWHIVAKENGHTFLDKDGIKKGDQVSFSTSTGMKTTFEICGTWSEKQDTTLKIKMHIDY